MVSSSDRQLSQMVRQLVHDCRQPLTRALGLVSLAQVVHPNTAEDLKSAEDALQEIDHLLKRMLEMVPGSDPK